MEKIIVLFMFSTSVFGQTLKPYKTETISGVKWGYIDTITNQKVISAKYDAATEFSDNLATVSFTDRIAYIDSTGKEVIGSSKKYHSGLPFTDGVTFVSKDGIKFGLIDKKGIELSQFVYDDVYDFTDGMCRVVKNKKVGFINKKGLEIVPCKYFWAEPFEGGTEKDILTNTSPYHWEFSNATGFINKLGVEIVKPIYYNDGTFNIGNGYMVVCKKNLYPTSDQYGIIDITGKFVCQLNYNIKNITAYKNFAKLRMIKTDLLSYEGFIDYTGKEIFPINFEQITNWEFGPNKKEYAKVFFHSGNFFYIDETLKCVEYDGVQCPE